MKKSFAIGAVFALIVVSTLGFISGGGSSASVQNAPHADNIDNGGGTNVVLQGIFSGQFNYVVDWLSISNFPVNVTNQLAGFNVSGMDSSAWPQMNGSYTQKTPTDHFQWELQFTNSAGCILFENIFTHDWALESQTNSNYIFGQGREEFIYFNPSGQDYPWPEGGYWACGAISGEDCSYLPTVQNLYSISVSSVSAPASPLYVSVTNLIAGQFITNTFAFAPTKVEAFILCVTNENGFSAGDIWPWASFELATADLNSEPPCIVLNGQNSYVLTFNTFTGGEGNYAIPKRPNGVGTTPAHFYNFRIVLRAYY